MLQENNGEEEIVVKRPSFVFPFASVGFLILVDSLLLGYSIRLKGSACWNELFPWFSVFCALTLGYLVAFFSILLINRRNLLHSRSVEEPWKIDISYKKSCWTCHLLLLFIRWILGKHSLKLFLFQHFSSC